MLPSHMVGGMSQPSSSSSIFFQGDGLSQVAGNQQLSSNFRNPSSMLPALARANTVPVSVGDIGNTVLNSVANSGPSVGESSLLTGSNSGISGGPQFQRSASMNNESYMRLPTSPTSFSSNNISISGSSVIDGSSVVRQSSNQDQVSRLPQRNQQIQGATSFTSLPSSPQVGPIQLPGNTPTGASSFMQDALTISQLQKKPRLDIKQKDVMQQQVLQHLLQRQDSGHLQSPNPQLQALIQLQRRQQEQQILQSMSPLQRVQFLQQQQQQQLHLRQRVQGMQQAASGIKRPLDGGVCSRRLMQYLYHQRQRPVENAISYWRKFVAEYYSPRAKKRWCLSRYDNAGNHSLGVFPQASQDPWQCDICGSKSGRGFEATFEVLPRLNEIKVGSGVIDELLFLDLPREYRFPTGMMVLEYAKAVQESVYEQLRVTREGQLRILFTSELKILSWEFCARRHEVLLPRRVVTPQVNQLLQVAQKCQSTISESEADGVPQQDLQANNAMGVVVAAGCQLSKSLELQSLNDLGFSKRYVRCLQIADVVNSMKDLVDFCREQKVGPIEGLKNFPRHTSEPKPQMHIKQEMDTTGKIQGPPTDQNTPNKLLSLHPGLNINNNNQLMANQGVLSGSAALANYQNSLMRKNSMNSTHDVLVKQEPSSVLSTSSQAIPSSSTPGSSSGCVLQNTSQAPSQLKGSTTASVNGPQQQNQSLPTSQGGQALQQHMMQQLLQDMSRKGNTLSQQPSSLQNRSDNIVGDHTNGPENIGNTVPSRNNSFKSGPNGESPSATVAYNGFEPKSSDLSDDAMMDQDNSISQFADGFFDTYLDDNMDFSWKV